MKKKLANFLLKIFLLILLAKLSRGFTVWQSPWLGPQDSTDIRGSTVEDDFFVTSFIIACYPNQIPKAFSLTTKHSDGREHNYGWYSVSGDGDVLQCTIPVNTNGPINF